MHQRGEVAAIPGTVMNHYLRRDQTVGPEDEKMIHKIHPILAAAMIPAVVVQTAPILHLRIHIIEKVHKEKF